MDTRTTFQDLIYGELLNDDGTAIRQTLAGSPPTMFPLVGVWDTDAYTGILEGGLYDRPIKATGAANTDRAFYGTANAQQIRPCGFVRGPRRSRHTQADDVPGAYVGISTIYLYADRSRTGRQRLELAGERIRQLTDGWRTTGPTGYPVTFQFLDVAEPYDTEEFIGAIATIARISMTGIYENEV